MARECPNQRVMLMNDSGEYESQDMDETSNDELNMKYLDVGESLITSRVLSVIINPEETAQHENIFHIRCTIQGKVFNLTIDGGSYMVNKLNLERSKHHRPYRLRWLNDMVELKITYQVIVPFSVGHYHDQVLCDVVPTQVGHLLLGRSW